jgi:hypothetical protein
MPKLFCLFSAFFLAPNWVAFKASLRWYSKMAPWKASVPERVVAMICPEVLPPYWGS